MPLYEYKCSKCRNRFERIVKSSERDEIVCPQCGGVVERLVQAPAIQFKGAGWYVTDYADKGKANKRAAKAEADANKSDSSDKSDSSAKVGKKTESGTASATKSDKKVTTPKSA